MTTKQQSWLIPALVALILGYLLGTALPIESIQGSFRQVIKYEDDSNTKYSAKDDVELNTPNIKWDASDKDSVVVVTGSYAKYEIDEDGTVILGGNIATEIIAMCQEFIIEHEGEEMTDEQVELRMKSCNELIDAMEARGVTDATEVE